MDNKGWGLSVLLGFLAVFGVFLIISSILYNKNFSDVNINEEEEKEKEEQEVEEAVQEEYKNKKSNETVTVADYEKLENNLMESAKKYINQKKITSDYKIIITYNDIKEEKLITEFNDPKTGNTCNGYVIYYNNEINSFVRCVGNYQTSNYDEELE